jgi:predicted amino acid-binding ACT domain protein
LTDEHSYFPRKLNIVVPLGESVHELIVVGRDEIGALAKVTEVLARHNANMISVGTYDAGVSGEFLFSIFANLANADCTPEKLVSEIKGLAFVARVSISDTEDVVYDQHLFPLVLFGESRAVIVTAQSIVSMEQDLQKQIGKQGLQVLFEVGRSSGSNLSALHKAMLPEADRDALLRTAKDDMRARGWGIVDVEVAEKASSKTEVTVQEPIFAGIEGARESWWLMGLVSGFLEAIYGLRTVVSGKPRYDAAKKVFSFDLVEYHPDARSAKDLV